MMGLFGFSAILGVCAVFAHQFAADSDTSESALTAVVFPSPQVVSEMQAHPVGALKGAVDVDTDALRGFYFLTEQGELSRTYPRRQEIANRDALTSLRTISVAENGRFRSLALHPQFLQKEHPGYGCLYTIVSEPAGSGQSDFAGMRGYTELTQEVLYEFRVGDPLAKKMKVSTREVMRFSHVGTYPLLNRLAFDAQGHLFVGVGDGLGHADNSGQAEQAGLLTSVFGKVLRIDPTGINSENGRYGIPPTNPFVSARNAIPELWACGLRTPLATSYDPYQDLLCIAETDANGVNSIHLCRGRGEHFGWGLDIDGLAISAAERQQFDSFITPPLLKLDGANAPAWRSCGSVFYLGEDFPSLTGKLIIADENGGLLGVTWQGNAPLKFGRIAIKNLAGGHFQALKTTASGELLLLGGDGTAYEMKKPDERGDRNSRRSALSFCAR